MRDVFKQVLLIAINTSNKTSALKAINWEINKNRDDYGWAIKEGLDFSKVIDKFVAMHSVIDRYFFSIIGVKLQNLDSIIATKVINRLTREEIPVLSIHDSFVVTADKSDYLKELMDTMFRETLDDLGISTEVTSITKGRGLEAGHYNLIRTHPDFRDQMIDTFIKAEYNYPEWHSRYEEFKGRKLEGNYYG